MLIATTAPCGRLAPGSELDRLVGNVFGGLRVKTSDGRTAKGVIVDGLVVQATLSALKTENMMSMRRGLRFRMGQLTIRDILLVRNDRVTGCTTANFGYKVSTLAVVVRC